MAVQLPQGPGDDVARGTGGELLDVVQHLVDGRLAGQISSDASTSSAGNSDSTP